MAFAFEKVKEFNCGKCDHHIDSPSAEPLTIMPCPKCNAGIEVPALFGPYLLLRPLGNGSTGQVFQGRDQILDRDVAVKLLNAKTDSSDPVNEARTLAALNHENIVQIYRLGEHQGQPFAVMELVVGHSAEKLCDPQHRPDERHVIDLAIGVVSGLRAADEVGLLHTDVQPRRILISETDGKPRLIDFGAAPVDKDTNISGTPDYVAPEITNGDPHTVVSDIYSLGATLYHIFTSKPPFKNDNPREVIQIKRTYPAPSLAHYRDDLNPATVDLVARMLETDPTRRHQSFDDLDYALRSTRDLLGRSDEEIAAANLAAAREASHEDGLNAELIDSDRPKTLVFATPLVILVIAALAGAYMMNLFELPDFNGNSKKDGNQPVTKKETNPPSPVVVKPDKPVEPPPKPPVKPVIDKPITPKPPVVTPKPVAPTPAKNQPVAHWTFDANADDTVGQFHGKSTNGSLIPNGMIGGAIELSGNNSFIAVPQITNATKAMTLTMWVRFKAVHNGYQSLFHSDGWEDRDTHLFFFKRTLSCDIKAIVSRAVNSTFVYDKNHVNQWVHIAYTYSADNRRVRFFVNGGLVNEFPVKNPQPLPLGPGRIGGWNQEGRALHATVDDVRIYTEELPLRLIAKIASVKSTNPTPPQPPKPKPNPPKPKPSPKTDPAVNGLIAHLKFDHPSHIAFDSTGQYKTEPKQGPVAHATGPHKSAIQFDGRDDHITFNEGFADFTKGITVALWAKPTSQGGGATWARFIDFAGDGPNDNIVFAREGNSNHLAVHLMHGKNKVTDVRAVNTIHRNKWQHFAFTITASGRAVIYRNGVIVAEKFVQLPSNVTRTQNFVGRSTFGHDKHFKGFMDDLRVYNRALTHNQIIDIVKQTDSINILTNAERLMLQPQVTPPTPGLFRLEYFDNKGDADMAEAIKSPPLRKSWLTKLDPPRNVGDHYVQRMTGLIMAPYTGRYRFYIAGDDECSLLLSSDDDPKNLRSIIPLGRHESEDIELQAGEIYFIEALHREVNGGDWVKVDWMLPTSKREDIRSNRAVPLEPMKMAERHPRQRGSILRESFNSGGNTADINHVVRTIKQSPIADEHDYHDAFEDGLKRGHKYTQKFSGFLYPPMTGEYHFHLLADRCAELWISDNDRKQSARKFFTRNHSRPGQYDQHSRSGAIQFKAGKRYYIEVYHGVDGGKPFLSLGWELPNGKLERPISRKRLSPHFPLGADKPKLHEVAFARLRPGRATSSNKTKLEIQADGSVLASHNSTDADYTIACTTSLTNLTAFQFEALPHPSLPGNGPGFGQAGAFSIADIRLSAAPKGQPDQKTPVEFQSVTSDLGPLDSSVRLAIDDNDTTAWKVINSPGEPRIATFVTKSPVGFDGGTILTFTIKHAKANLGRFRLAATSSRDRKVLVTAPTEYGPGTSSISTRDVRLFLNAGAASNEKVVRAGKAWRPLPAYRVGGYGYDGGIKTTLNPKDIKEPLERTCIHGINALRFTLPDGRYAVQLLFAEHVIEKPDHRVFAIDIEGVEVLPRGDLAKGGFRRTVWWPQGKQRVITVKDGVLDIEFRSIQHHNRWFPLVQAVRVESVGALKPHDPTKGTEPEPIVRREPKGYRKYINLGGQREAKVGAITWEPARPFVEGSYGHVGGKRLEHGGEKNPVLKTVLHHVQSMRFTVPKGRYHVSLVFIDHWANKPGERQFAFGIEGKFMADVDIIKGAEGKHKHLPWSTRNLKKKKSTIYVGDGVLDIDFKDIKGGATVAAVTIESVGILSKTPDRPSNPAVDAAKAEEQKRARREEAAQKLLAIAKRLIESNYISAHQKLESITRTYRDTNAALEARDLINKIEADPKKSRSIKKAEKEREAQGMLELAKSYFNLKKYDEAYEELRRLRDPKFASTKAAASSQSLFNQVREIRDKLRKKTD